MSVPPAVAAAPSPSSAAEILGWEGLGEIERTLGLKVVVVTATGPAMNNPIIGSKTR